MKRLLAKSMHGAAFGIIEATIMMLGVMLGLSVTSDRSVVILGIVAAGVADAVANSAAFHVSEEAEKGNSHKQALAAMAMAFLGTLFPVAVLLFPLVLMPLFSGIITALVLGALIISAVGVRIALKSKKSPLPIVAEYLAMASIAVIVTYIAGLILNYAGI